jgi:Na+-translocating ferredoxin:NAD+ oxidoreductase subunit G
MLVRHMIITALLLGGFAVIGTGIVAVTENNTRELIKENQRIYLLRSLNEVVPPEKYDNDLETDVLYLKSRDLLGSRHPVSGLPGTQGRRAGRRDLQPGRAGRLQWRNPPAGRYQVRGRQHPGRARVVSHRETPGLGDAIEIERSDWVMDCRPYPGQSRRAGLECRKGRRHL